jgi:hypothetical protein
MRDIGKTPEIFWGDALDDAAMRRENGWSGIGSDPSLHDMFQDVDGMPNMLHRNILR